jgi:hypothetical protein
VSVRDDQDSDYQSRIYFTLDDHTVDALELTLDHLRRAPTRPMSWKWVLIGIHTALHGSFGLVLRRSDGAQLLVPKQERQTYQRWERERAKGVPEAESFLSRVDLFLDLYNKVQIPSRMNYFGGVPLEPTTSQTQSVVRLDSLRGRLTHFSHIMLVIEVDDILDLLSDSLEIVEFLLIKAQPVVLSDEQLADRGTALITELKAEIESTRNRYQLQQRTE